MYKLIKNFFSSSKFARKLCGRYYSKKENGVFRSKTLRRLYKDCRNVDAGYMSYGWNTDEINGPITIGKYCSFGPGVRRIEVNHSITGVTSHPCWFNPSLGWVKNDFRERTKLTIGNDVWIGANVIILPSVSYIGNGSIIGAGAVVTKNIESYEIWGGVPARLIKNRFEPEICEALENSKWWELDEERLKVFAKYFNSPLSFLEHISE